MSTGTLVVLSSAALSSAGIFPHDDVEPVIVEVDPGKITTIVVVGEQGVGAEAQEIRERLVVAGRRRIAQR